ncbi:FtsX-like permease family protein [Nonomuraea longispora]|uniref:FtsX-like permease family protein n=1 Tax=Nonomuraea longispora TaxID=1848320 RepID=A0A4R4NP27_9ACTN|nr:ABC transporter permease [Nonomuraea longispora]TDC10999.1 FtsX-like permease family protein [Nonomuraea longispora]
MRLIRDALRDMRAHRIRTALGGLSLFLALLSLAGTTVVGTVVEDLFVAREEQLNGRVPTLATSLDIGSVGAVPLDELISTIAAEIRARDGEFAIIQEKTVQVSSTPGDELTREYVDGTVSLVAGRLDQVRRLPVLEGRWLDSDEHVYPGGIVVNMAGREVYGGVGDVVLLQGSPHATAYPQRIVGVISDGVGGAMIYQSLSSAVHFQPHVIDAVFSSELLVHLPGETVREVAGAIRDASAALGVPKDSVQPAVKGDLDSLLGNLAMMELGFGVVSGVMLLVAMLGLLNIGLATFRERARELSLRRALGATRLRIFGLVVAGTTLLSLGVAVIAIGVSYLAVAWLTPRLIDPASALAPPGYPMLAAVISLSASFGAGLIGGLAPAVAAARTSPTRLLRA